jgi:hypothetical protein
MSAPIDVAALRDEAKWMFVRGATVDDVVRMFGAAGVLEAHGRPEAERILGVVRAMCPCARCGAWLMKHEVYLDLMANSLCDVCFTKTQVRMVYQPTSLIDAFIEAETANTMHEIDRATGPARTHDFRCRRCGLRVPAEIAAGAPHEPATAIACAACGWRAP